MYSFVFLAVSESSVNNIFQIIGQALNLLFEELVGMFHFLSVLFTYITQPFQFAINFLESLVSMPSYLLFMVLFVVVIGIVKMLLSRGSFSE